MQKLNLAFVVALCAVGATWSYTQGGGQDHPPLRTLIVGGGPSLKYNQVAIESNVRYVAKLLPPVTPLRVLFADGNLDSSTVLYTGDDKKSHYRKPDLPRMDGPSRLTDVQSEFAALAKTAQADPKTPTLLYFTGHGSGNRASNYANNHYDLWSNEEFTVKDFAAALKGFPKNNPITIVMVECYSGAFGNLLFEGGDPDGPLADLKVCGFYASVPQRVAAGCTPIVNEAYYRDFTTYFFAALSGTDRLGRPTTGADYNHDGRVGMNEAFAYTLIHDDSIDTPVCTSDVFLRRFVKTPDAEIFTARYPQVVSWASPSQRAALEALSEQLKLTGDDRSEKAFAEFQSIDMASEADRDVQAIRFIRLTKSVVLAHTLAGMPDKNLKKRFADLLKMESCNPIKP